MNDAQSNLDEQVRQMAREWECPASREIVEAQEEMFDGCPVCGNPSSEHLSEPVRD